MADPFVVGDYNAAAAQGTLRNEDGDSYRPSDTYLNDHGGWNAYYNAFNADNEARYGSGSGGAPNVQYYLNQFQLQHQQQYGTPINRPWNADADASAAGNSIIQNYTNALNTYNTSNGTNLAPSVTGIDQLEVTPWAQSRPADNKAHTGGFFSAGNAGRAFLGAALGVGGAEFFGAGAGGFDIGSGLSLSPDGDVLGGSLFTGGGAIPDFAAGFNTADLASGASNFDLGGGLSLSPDGDVGGGLFQGGVPDAAMSSAGLGAPSWYSSAFADGGMPASGPSWMSQLTNYAQANPFSTLKNAYSVGSGIYGQYQSYKQRQLAAQLSKQSDPWGASGGRATADAQLQEFMRDPTTAAANDPSYALRLQAAQRAAAPYGQGSGKMAVDAASASTDWYNQRVAQLGGLAGAGQTPGAGGQLQLAGVTGANDLSSKALASIGYGVGRDNIPPAMQQQLMMRMMQQMGQGG